MSRLASSYRSSTVLILVFLVLSWLQVSPAAAANKSEFNSSALRKANASCEGVVSVAADPLEDTFTLDEVTRVQELAAKVVPFLGPFATNEGLLDPERVESMFRLLRKKGIAVDSEDFRNLFLLVQRFQLNMGGIDDAQRVRPLASMLKLTDAPTKRLAYFLAQMDSLAVHGNIVASAPAFLHRSKTPTTLITSDLGLPLAQLSTALRAYIEWTLVHVIGQRSRYSRFKMNAERNQLIVMSPVGVYRINLKLTSFDRTSIAPLRVFTTDRWGRANDHLIHGQITQWVADPEARSYARTMFRADPFLHPHMVPPSYALYPQPAVLSEYQEGIVSQMLKLDEQLVRDHKGNGPIKLGLMISVGEGKTLVVPAYHQRVPAKVVKKPGVKARYVVVVENSAILKQTVESYKRDLNLPEDKILMMFGDEDEVEFDFGLGKYTVKQGAKRSPPADWDLIVVTRSTLHRRWSTFETAFAQNNALPADARRPIRVTIDEAHHVGTKGGQFRRLLNDFEQVLTPEDRIVMNSATLEHPNRNIIRDDLKGAVVASRLDAAELARLRQGLDIPFYARTQYLRSIIDGFTNPIENSKALDAKDDGPDSIRARLRRQMDADPGLYKIVANLITQLRPLRSGPDRFFVFEPTQDRADDAAAYLQKFLTEGLPPPSDDRFRTALAIHTDMSQAEQRRRLRWFRAQREFRGVRNNHHIVASVGLFLEGLDVPEINGIVLMRNLESLMLMMQIIGRGSRLDAFKTDLALFDVPGTVTEWLSRADGLWLRSTTHHALTASEWGEPIKDAAPLVQEEPGPLGPVNVLDVNMERALLRERILMNKWREVGRRDLEAARKASGVLSWLQYDPNDLTRKTTIVNFQTWFGTMFERFPESARKAASDKWRQLRLPNKNIVIETISTKQREEAIRAFRLLGSMFNGLGNPQDRLSFAELSEAEMLTFAGFRRIVYALDPSYLDLKEREVAATNGSPLGFKNPSHEERELLSEGLRNGLILAGAESLLEPLARRGFSIGTSDEVLNQFRTLIEARPLLRAAVTQLMPKLGTVRPRVVQPEHAHKLNLYLMGKIINTLIARTKLYDAKPWNLNGLVALKNDEDVLVDNLLSEVSYYDILDTLDRIEHRLNQDPQIVPAREIYAQPSLTALLPFSKEKRDEKSADESPLKGQRVDPSPAAPPVAVPNKTTTTEKLISAESPNRPHLAGPALERAWWPVTEAEVDAFIKSGKAIQAYLSNESSIDFRNVLASALRHTPRDAVAKWTEDIETCLAQLDRTYNVDAPKREAAIALIRTLRLAAEIHNSGSLRERVGVPLIDRNQAIQDVGAARLDLAGFPMRNPIGENTLRKDGPVIALPSAADVIRLKHMMNTGEALPALKASEVGRWILAGAPPIRPSELFKRMYSLLRASPAIYFGHAGVLLKEIESQVASSPDDQFHDRIASLRLAQLHNHLLRVTGSDAFAPWPLDAFFPGASVSAPEMTLVQILQVIDYAERRLVIAQSEPNNSSVFMNLADGDWRDVSVADFLKFKMTVRTRALLEHFLNASGPRVGSQESQQLSKHVDYWTAHLPKRLREQYASALSDARADAAAFDRSKSLDDRMMRFIRVSQIFFGFVNEISFEERYGMGRIERHPAAWLPAFKHMNVILSDVRVEALTSGKEPVNLAFARIKDRKTLDALEARFLAVFDADHGADESIKNLIRRAMLDESSDNLLQLSAVLLPSSPEFLRAVGPLDLRYFGKSVAAITSAKSTFPEYVKIAIVGRIVNGLIRAYDLDLKFWNIGALTSPQLINQVPAHALNSRPSYADLLEVFEAARAKTRDMPGNANPSEAAPTDDPLRRAREPDGILAYLQKSPNLKRGAKLQPNSSLKLRDEPPFPFALIINNLLAQLGSRNLEPLTPNLTEKLKNKRQVIDISPTASEDEVRLVVEAFDVITRAFNASSLEDRLGLAPISAEETRHSRFVDRLFFGLGLARYVQSFSFKAHNPRWNLILQEDSAEHTARIEAALRSGELLPNHTQDVLKILDAKNDTRAELLAELISELSLSGEIRTATGTRPQLADDRPTVKDMLASLKGQKSNYISGWLLNYFIRTFKLTGFKMWDLNGVFNIDSPEADALNATPSLYDAFAIIAAAQRVMKGQNPKESPLFVPPAQPNPPQAAPHDVVDSPKSAKPVLDLQERIRLNKWREVGRLDMELARKTGGVLAWLQFDPETLTRKRAVVNLQAWFKPIFGRFPESARQAAAEKWRELKLPNSDLPIETMSPAQRKEAIRAFRLLGIMFNTLGTPQDRMSFGELTANEMLTFNGFRRIVYAFHPSYLNLREDEVAATARSPLSLRNPTPEERELLTDGVRNGLLLAGAAPLLEPLAQRGFTIGTSDEVLSVFRRLIEERPVLRAAVTQLLPGLGVHRPDRPHPEHAHKLNMYLMGKIMNTLIARAKLYDPKPWNLNGLLGLTNDEDVLVGDLLSEISYFAILDTLDRIEARLQQDVEIVPAREGEAQTPLAALAPFNALTAAAPISKPAAHPPISTSKPTAALATSSAAPTKPTPVNAAELKTKERAWWPVTDADIAAFMGPNSPLVRHFPDAEKFDMRFMVSNILGRTPTHLLSDWQDDIQALLEQPGRIYVMSKPERAAVVYAVRAVRLLTEIFNSGTLRDRVGFARMDRDYVLTFAGFTKFYAMTSPAVFEPEVRLLRRDGPTIAASGETMSLRQRMEDPDFLPGLRGTRLAEWITNGGTTLGIVTMTEDILSLLKSSPAIAHGRIGRALALAEGNIARAMKEERDKITLHAVLTQWLAEVHNYLLNISASDEFEPWALDVFFDARSTLPDGAKPWTLSELLLVIDHVEHRLTREQSLPQISESFMDLSRDDWKTVSPTDLLEFRRSIASTKSLEAQLEFLSPASASPRRTLIDLVSQWILHVPEELKRKYPAALSDALAEARLFDRAKTVEEKHAHLIRVSRVFFGLVNELSLKDRYGLGRIARRPDVWASAIANMDVVFSDISAATLQRAENENIYLRVGQSRTPDAKALAERASALFEERPGATREDFKRTIEPLVRGQNPNNLLRLTSAILTHSPALAQALSPFHVSDIEAVAAKLDKYDPPLPDSIKLFIVGRIVNEIIRRFDLDQRPWDLNALSALAQVHQLPSSLVNSRPNFDDLIDVLIAARQRMSATEDANAAEPRPLNPATRTWWPLDEAETARFMQNVSTFRSWLSDDERLSIRDLLSSFLLHVPQEDLLKWDADIAACLKQPDRFYNFSEPSRASAEALIRTLRLIAEMQSSLSERDRVGVEPLDRDLILTEAGLRRLFLMGAPLDGDNAVEALRLDGPKIILPSEPETVELREAIAAGKMISSFEQSDLQRWLDRGAPTVRADEVLEMTLAVLKLSPAIALGPARRPLSVIANLLADASDAHRRTADVQALANIWLVQIHNILLRTAGIASPAPVPPSVFFKDSSVRTQSLSLKQLLLVIDQAERRLTLAQAKSENSAEFMNLTHADWRDVSAADLLDFKRKVKDRPTLEHLLNVSGPHPGQGKQTLVKHVEHWLEHVPKSIVGRFAEAVEVARAEAVAFDRSKSFDERCERFVRVTRIFFGLANELSFKERYGLGRLVRRPSLWGEPVWQMNVIFSDTSLIPFLLEAGDDLTWETIRDRKVLDRLEGQFLNLFSAKVRANEDSRRVVSQAISQQNTVGMLNLTALVLSESSALRDQASPASLLGFERLVASAHEARTSKAEIMNNGSVRRLINGLIRDFDLDSAPWDLNLFTSGMSVHQVPRSMVKARPSLEDLYEVLSAARAKAEAQASSAEKDARSEADHPSSESKAGHPATDLQVPKPTAWREVSAAEVKQLRQPGGHAPTDRKSPISTRDMLLSFTLEILPWRLVERWRPELEEVLEKNVVIHHASDAAGKKGEIYVRALKLMAAITSELSPVERQGLAALTEPEFLMETMAAKLSWMRRPDFVAEELLPQLADQTKFSPLASTPQTRSEVCAALNDDQLWPGPRSSEFQEWLNSGCASLPPQQLATLIFNECKLHPALAGGLVGVTIHHLQGLEFRASASATAQFEQFEAQNNRALGLLSRLVNFLITNAELNDEPLWRLQPSDALAESIAVSEPSLPALFRILERSEARLTRDAAQLSGAPPFVDLDVPDTWERVTRIDQTVIAQKEFSFTRFNSLAFGFSAGPSDLLEHVAARLPESIRQRRLAWIARARNEFSTGKTSGTIRGVRILAGLVNELDDRQRLGLARLDTLECLTLNGYQRLVLMIEPQLVPVRPENLKGRDTQLTLRNMDQEERAALLQLLTQSPVFQGRVVPRIESWINSGAKSPDLLELVLLVENVFEEHTSSSSEYDTRKLVYLEQVLTAQELRKGGRSVELQRYAILKLARVVNSIIRRRGLNETYWNLSSYYERESHAANSTPVLRSPSAWDLFRVLEQELRYSSERFLTR